MEITQMISNPNNLDPGFSSLIRMSLSHKNFLIRCHLFQNLISYQHWKTETYPAPNFCFSTMSTFCAVKRGGSCKHSNMGIDPNFKSSTIFITV